MNAALSADEPTWVVEYPRKMKDSCQIKKVPLMWLGRKTALESSENLLPSVQISVTTKNVCTEEATIYIHTAESF
jgi:hypothetical protein